MGYIDQSINDVKITGKRLGVKHHRNKKTLIIPGIMPLFVQVLDATKVSVLRELTVYPNMFYSNLLNRQFNPSNVMTDSSIVSESSYLHFRKHSETIFVSPTPALNIFLS